MKKLMTAVLAAAIAFTPVGGVVFHEEASVVSAKSYKSGKKSFNLNNSPSTNQQKDTQTNSLSKKTTKDSTQTAAKPKTGGIMKGLLFGGLAGLMLGGLLANLGGLGAIIGLLINVLAVVVLISVIRKIFTHFKKKREEEKMNPWKS
ncbi:putative lipid-binding transport protein (Tim44 family) [Bacillus fengqiuensis]|nr:putative lipid-binding transport protein (Tim44 family) [Bacillus fengqiuensis]